MVESNAYHDSSTARLIYPDYLCKERSMHRASRDDLVRELFAEVHAIAADLQGAQGTAEQLAVLCSQVQAACHVASAVLRTLEAATLSPEDARWSSRAASRARRSKGSSRPASVLVWATAEGLAPPADRAPGTAAHLCRGDHDVLRPLDGTPGTPAPSR
jgi:hypothetical protein